MHLLVRNTEFVLVLGLASLVTKGYLYVVGVGPQCSFCKKFHEIAEIFALSIYKLQFYYKCPRSRVTLRTHQPLLAGYGGEIFSLGQQVLLLGSGESIRLASQGPECGRSSCDFFLPVLLRSLGAEFVGRCDKLAALSLIFKQKDAEPAGVMNAGDFNEEDVGNGGYLATSCYRNIAER